MSGGNLCDYQQEQIEHIAERIQEYIDYNKVEKKPEDRYSWEDDDEPICYYNFSDKTIEEFKNGIEILKKAYIYAHRIDWLVSGDDGEDTFHKRLKEDLEELNLK